MTVRVLLFAYYRDVAGTSEWTLDVPAGSRAIDAVATLRKEVPRIPERPVIAINKEYSELDDLLTEGDELALLPPVAGG